MLRHLIEYVMGGDEDVKHEFELAFQQKFAIVLADAESQLNQLRLTANVPSEVARLVTPR